jgi:hypothetical protein
MKHGLGLLQEAAVEGLSGDRGLVLPLIAETQGLEWKASSEDP